MAEAATATATEPAAAGIVLPPISPLGQPLQNIETPALLIDLACLEYNIAKLNETLAPYPHVRVRPHAKSHKCPEIAKLQIQAGAVGVCCQKVSEAVALAAGGVTDILVSNEIVERPKIDRLIALVRAGINISVLADHLEHVTQYAKAARDGGVILTVLIEVNVGQNRCGVKPYADAGNVVALAHSISAEPSLVFGGLHCYHGSAQHIRSETQRQQVVRDVADLAAKCRDALEAAGIDVPKITAGGTGSYLLEAKAGVHTECQTGSYIFMDADYGKNHDAHGHYVSDFRQSLYVLTTVISTAPTERLVVVDAGMKAHSLDSGPPLVADLSGRVRAEAVYENGGDEHGKIFFPSPESASKFRIGDKLLLIPGHCDPTVNMHSEFLCFRDGVVQQIWPISARGPGL